MIQEINPKDTKRAAAFELWMQSPMPMVTITKTFDVSRLRKISYKRNLSFNAVMCYFIGKAASGVEEFYMLPKGDKFLKYDKLGINVIVKNSNEGICSCDIPFDDDIDKFLSKYDRLTTKAIQTSQSIFDESRMIIGTSALPDCEIDSVVNQYCLQWANPILIWGKYRKGLFKTILPVSFQFHHVQMDGGEACRFLNELQYTINDISKSNY